MKTDEDIFSIDWDKFSFEKKKLSETQQIDFMNSRREKNWSEYQLETYRKSNPLKFHTLTKLPTWFKILTKNFNKKVSKFKNFVYFFLFKKFFFVNFEIWILQVLILWTY